MNIETFLAQYPDIQKADYSIGSENDFNKIIFQKKEFNDLKLPAVQPEQPDDFYNHQKIIARFLMSHTLYDELLLFHSPGTGKTFTAIHTIESVLQSSSFKKAVIIVPNETLVERFKHEIIFVGTQKKYLPPEEEDDSRLPASELYAKQFAYGKKNIRKQYHITTHERFYNQLKMLEQIPDKMKADYSNAIVVLDEAHRIANNNDWYPVYFDFLHRIENRKILLMTGTPMKNQVSEIAPLMNLILPNHLLFRIGKEFEMDYMMNGMIRKEQEKELEKRFLGRISYLKSKPNIEYIFMGEKIQGFTYPVLQHRMSSHQQSSFLKIQSNRETFYKESLQASLFVFEDGTFGMNGFNKNIVFNQNHYHCKMLEPFRRISIQDRLLKLGKYSTKYQSVISSIVSAPNENIFVYSYFMRGSGAILFGLCLELFGFSRAYDENSVKSGNKKRYAILSDSIGTNVSSVLRVFNSRENRNGELIQVLIGGKQIEEGVTFYSIQQIHILTPTWNLSSLDQTLARGIRLKSHRYLPPQTLVKIYLHVSIQESDQKISKIQINHSEKLVLFTYNIATLEKDIQTILRDCRSNPSDLNTIYYIKIQNSISEDLQLKCIDYGLSRPIQNSNQFVGLNGLTYQVAPSETVFFTPYLYNIYNNIVYFYSGNQYVHSGLLLRDKTILTTSDLSEWDFFILSDRQIPKTAFTIRSTNQKEEEVEAILLSFDTSFETGSAQVIPISMIQEYPSNPHLYILSSESQSPSLLQTQNPYHYISQLNRDLTPEEAQAFMYLLYNIPFITSTRQQYPKRYQTLLETLLKTIPEQLLFKTMTQAIQKRIVLEYNLIPSILRTSTTGEAFLNLLNETMIRDIYDKIKDNLNHIAYTTLDSFILDQEESSVKIDKLRKQLEQNSILLDSFLELYQWPLASIPYIDFVITQVDYTPFKIDIIEQLLPNVSFFGEFLTQYNVDQTLSQSIFQENKNVIDTLIRFVEPYGLTFPYAVPTTLVREKGRMSDPILILNSKGQSIVVGITDVLFTKKIARPELSKPNSTDFQLYLLSQQKDFAIKRIEYLIKRTAFDCALTYDRNIVKDGSETSRECEYTDCIYRCKGVTEQSYEIDKNTYQLYFKDEYQNILIRLLKDIFQRQFSVTIWEILLLLQNQYTEYQVCEALRRIIRTSVVFTNRYGFKSYLQESNNLFFLTTRFYDSSVNAGYYTEYPVMTHALDFMDTVEYLLYSEDEMNRQLYELSFNSEEDKKQKIVSLSPIIQEAFIENAIVAKLKNQMNGMVEWILDQYRDYIHLSQDAIYSTFLGVHRFYEQSENEWRTKKVDTNNSVRMKALIQTEKGIYGFENELNQFIIVNLSDVPMDLREKESKKRGKNCITHKLKELVEIAQTLNIPIPINPKKSALCGLLKTWFTDHGLMF